VCSSDLWTSVGGEWWSHRAWWSWAGDKRTRTGRSRPRRPGWLTSWRWWGAPTAGHSSPVPDKERQRCWSSRTGRRPWRGSAATSVRATQSSTRTTSPTTFPESSGSPFVDGQADDLQPAVLVGQRDDPGHPVEAFVPGFVAGIVDRHETEPSEFGRQRQGSRTAVRPFQDLVHEDHRVGVVVGVHVTFGDRFGEGTRLDLGAVRLQGVGAPATGRRIGEESADL